MYRGAGMKQVAAPCRPARATWRWLAAVAWLLPLAPAGAAGDPVRGAQLYAARCQACHAIDDNVAGPRHRGVFGRLAGTQPGYDYSPALKQARVRWTAANLDRWLRGPEQFIPGQKMFYAVADAAERQDLIAFLKVQPARAQP